MIKVVRKVVMVAILMVCTVESFAKTNGKESSFDWTPVMNAIIQVESGGTPGLSAVLPVVRCRSPLFVWGNATTSWRRERVRSATPWTTVSTFRSRRRCFSWYSRFSIALMMLSMPSARGTEASTTQDVLLSVIMRRWCATWSKKILKTKKEMQSEWVASLFWF